MGKKTDFAIYMVCAATLKLCDDLEKDNSRAAFVVCTIATACGAKLTLETAKTTGKIVAHLLKTNRKNI